VTSEVAVIEALNTQIGRLGEVVGAHFGRHRDAEIYASQPGLGTILAARVLGEFGDDPHRFVDAKARKRYAGTAAITRASGKKKIVLARHVRNRRLGDALQQWALCSMRGSPRGQGVLPATARPQYRPPSGAAPTRQPPRRHPARLPGDRHHLRRTHRLGSARSCRCARAAIARRPFPHEDLGHVELRPGSVTASIDLFASECLSR